jgi:quercetin dioxygenase-like cupin family protein
MPTRSDTKRTMLLIVGVALLIAGSTALAVDSAAPPTAARQPLAFGRPAFAEGYELGLTKVAIPAGVTLGLHRHPGMQLARVIAGDLTLYVRRGAVPVYRGRADAAIEVRRIRSGQTGVVHAGEWIVETRDDVHRGANKGKVKVRIVIASLFRIGAPAAIPVS